MKTTQDVIREARESLKKSLPANESEPKKSGLFSSLIDNYVWGSDESDQTSPTTDENTIETPEMIFTVSDKIKSLREIYAEANISSQFTVDDLDVMVKSDKLKDQPLTMKQVAIPFALEARGVTIDDPINDAVQRDKALDSYTSTLYDNWKNTHSVNTQKESAIDNEMKEYFEAKQAEIEALKQETYNAQQQYSQFLIIKKEEEIRLSCIIDPFLGGKPNPITIGNEVEIDDTKLEPSSPQ
jgi:hypothetical protein